MDSPPNYPDGLTETAIDLLIEQAYDVSASDPLPTSALLDGSAAERRRRRMERRAVAAAMRELPVRRRAAIGPGEAA